MAYGRVSETFWHDGKIRSLSERARHLMLYLMSCPHGNRVGLFVLDLMYAAADIQWSAQEVDTGLRELHTADRIAWDEPNRVVFVKNYLRHNSLLNQSVVKGALNELAAVPDTPLLSDLLKAILDAQVGPNGPVMAHYKELENAVALRVRRIMRPIMPGIMPDIMKDQPKAPVPPGESHNAAHNDPHNAPQAWEGKGSKLATPSSSSPSLPEPSLSSPVPGLPDSEPDGGEADVKTETMRWLDTARASMIGIRGTEDVNVTIHGQRVGMGIEIKRYLRICELELDPPEVIAKAIALIPEVTGLERPCSLALWENRQAGTVSDVYQRCVHEAMKRMPTSSVQSAVRVGAIPPASEVERVEAARQEAKRKIEQLRAAEATP